MTLSADIEVSEGIELAHYNDYSNHNKAIFSLWLLYNQTIINIHMVSMNIRAWNTIKSMHRQHAYMYVQCNILPYSGKFSPVQIFADLLVSRLEEIFMVLIFAYLSAIAARAAHSMVYALCYSAMTSLFRCLFKILRFLFSRQPTYPRKTRNLAPCENFPLYGMYNMDTEAYTRKPSNLPHLAVVQHWS